MIWYLKYELSVYSFNNKKNYNMIQTIEAVFFSYAANITCRLDHSALNRNRKG